MRTRASRGWDHTKASLRCLSAHPDQARPRCSILWRHWTVPIAARLLSRSGCHWPVAVGGGALSQRARRVHLPILQPAPAAHSAREHSCADAPDAAVGSRARPETPRRGRSWRSCPAPAFGIEQQRVAIARALVNDPALILADEPVGNLDDENAGKIAALLARACRERGRTLILVTHDRNLIHPVDHVFDMRSGSLTSIETVFAS